MAKALFSKAADLDLEEITNYTINSWGEEQAWKYLEGLDYAASDSPTCRGWAGPATELGRNFVVSSIGNM